MAEPLLKPEVKKPRTWFGYLPVWSECVPLNPDTGRIDKVRCVANVVAGCVIGVRQTLSAIVSATLVFTSTDNATVVGMFPFGISMMWYSTLVGSVWYALFGRLQYNTSATQEVCAILYGAMAHNAGVALADTPERIPPTIMALIMTGTLVTGFCSLGLGKLGVGRSMLSFPSPVTSGFLGCIGFFLTRTALQITSGVHFQYFYPVSLGDFLSAKSMMPVTCLLAMVALMRWGPKFLSRMFPESRAVKKLGALGCQLVPLVIFYGVVTPLGISLDELSSSGWTYPAQGSHGFMELWTTYSLKQADMHVVYQAWPQMVALVLMSVLCTMTGVLGITGKFPSGPDGDPSPNEVVDFDAELTTIGLGCVVTGLTNGVVTFHRLGSSVQLRLDGGTHRMGILSSSCFVAMFFFSGAPLGHYIPKWFLGGLFMSSGISFLEGALKSYHNLPPAQYAVTVFCVVVAAFTSPVSGIGAGLALSIGIFLWDSANTSPVSSMSLGSCTVSRTKRPYWELRTLRKEGGRVLLLYLQGNLFFGSGQSLASALVQAVEGEGKPAGKSVSFCILSFAKVPRMDTSASEQLKAAVRKVNRCGCKVICCRMAPSVFETLSAAKIIENPDQDLCEVLGLTREAEAVKNPEEEEHHDDSFHDVGLATPSMRRVNSFRPLGQGDHDAFDHETDALDYCDDKLLREFCYSNPNTALEPFMQNYHACSTNGMRVEEDVFERMNLLPAGTMKRLQPFCEVQSKISPGTELREEDGTIYFILQGSVAYVDVAPEGVGKQPVALGESPTEAVAVDVKGVGVATKGFHGRGGKRLRKRYPPGNVVGNYSFCLRLVDRLIDPGLVSHMIVSSKFAHRTEVWALRRPAWQQMPEDLRRAVTEMVAFQLADEKQHTLLSGE